MPSSVEPATRVAVIGRTIELPAVRSVAWQNLSELPSLDNFDIIVIDLTTAAPHTPAMAQARKEELRRVLFSPSPVTGSQVLILGWHQTIEGMLLVHPSRTAMQGHQFIVTDAASADVRRWMEAVESYADAYGEHQWVMAQNYTHANLEVLASSPTGLMVALSWQLRHGASNTSIPVCMLPAGEDDLTEERIIDLLRLRCGIDSATPLPPWVETHERLPDLQTAEAQVDDLTSQISSLVEERAEALATAKEESRFLSLLFESGDRLEAIVHESLVLLGASLTEAERTADHDGRIRSPSGASVVLEVKGKSGQVGRRDARQLDEWVENAQRDNPDEDWTGLMVTNTERLLPPAERQDPLAPNARQLLANLGYSHITTLAIYDALHDLQDGTFDQVSWWSTVLSPTPPEAP